MSTNKFQVIYKKHLNALQNFAIKLTRNKMDADDLVQETAVKAFRNFHIYNTEKSFKNWSFTILKNTFITKYNARKRKNISITPIEDLHCVIQEPPQIESNTYPNRKLKILKKAITDLRGKSKEPFLMYVNGYTYKEISQYLSIPIGTVKSRINFARTKLKEVIQKSLKSSLSVNRVA